MYALARPLAILLSSWALLACAANNTAVIALDVGHSKPHPGAMSARGRTEFEFNAGLSQVLDAHLRSRGISTLQIGLDGNTIALTNRTKAAKAAKAGFFLAIHHDSVQPQYLKPWQWQGVTRHYADGFSGFSLFVSKKNPYFADSLQCASALGAALKRQGFHASPHHAEKIVGEDKTWADQANGVYYYDNLVVLKTATMPAVLLEAGVLVNPDEELSLQSAQTQGAIAQAIEFGLRACGQPKPPDQAQP